MLLSRNRIAITLILAGPFLSMESRALESSCTIPLVETRSAPAVDLIQNGLPVDRDELMDQIHSGFDSSTLEPQHSNIYRGEEQALIQYGSTQYPDTGSLMIFSNPLPGVDGLVRARVSGESQAGTYFQMNFSLDTHAALARNALLRKLGYAIPTPKHYPSLKLRFKSLEERNGFLDNLAGDTLTSRGRWVKGGMDAINRNETTIVFQDVVLEPALIEVPQLHWGILTPETLASRRSLRALLVPLTLLDITESVNMYSFESTKVFNEGLVFARPNAGAFKDETSIGDARWIGRKIARLTREDWSRILHSAHYPADIEALLIEKTLGRVNHLLKMLGIADFKKIPYDPNLTYGNVVRGKALQESYDGYPLRFTYGDPKSPLHASEILRFLGISGISSLASAAIDKADSYLQYQSPETIIQNHQEHLLQDVMSHYQNHPNEPYIQPVSIWGGTMINGNVRAGRSIVTGTYYGSDSKIQLVDTLSAGVSAGAFFGVSGIPKVGISLTPDIQFSRNYVHVRPLPDIKTAWKDSWLNVMVPKFMFHLSTILKGKNDESASDAVKDFMDQMQPGEIFIITDGFTGGGAISAQIPLGAMIGFMPSFGSLSAGATLGGNYGILTRTTLVRTKDGFQVYLNRINSENFNVDLNAQFFVRLLGATESVMAGKDHTRAFLFPEKFEESSENALFQSAIRSMLRKNNPELLEESFQPYTLDHKANGNRFRLDIGPFSWTTRVNFHRVEITPPIDPENRYHAEDFKRTVIDGQSTHISGTDLYGFFGKLLKIIHPLLSLGSGAKGDDPAASFMGKSHTFVSSAEIEITPGRNNQAFMKLQDSYAGWSMGKKRLLRLISKLGEQLSEFNPGAGLTNPDEFTQTKKVQSYNLAWSLLLYEKGIQNLLTLLNQEKTDTARAQNLMVTIMGWDAYRQYCQGQDLEPILYRGPVSYDDREPGDGTVTETSNGNMITVGCATPWMEAIYRLREALSSSPQIFATDIHEEKAAKEKIRVLNRTLTELHRELSLAELFRIIGKENAFFQVRISGFRTKDENGDSEYFSNTIGKVDAEMLAGPLSDISATSKISSNEIEARYLSNGY
jgi:hypothetical protein